MLRPITFACLVALIFAAALQGAQPGGDLASLEASLSKRLAHGAQTLEQSQGWADTCKDLQKFWGLLRARWPRGPGDARSRLAYYRARSWAQACAKAAPKGHDAERKNLDKLARGAELYLQAGVREEFWQKLLDQAAVAIKIGQTDKAEALLKNLPDLPSGALEARRLALKGIALASSGRHEEAVAAFDAFRSRFPAHPFSETVRYYTGLLYIHMGQSALGLQHLRSCNLDALPPVYRADVERTIQWVSRKMKRPQVTIQHYF